jgi:dienelactone hydrolase
MARPCSSRLLEAALLVLLMTVLLISVVPAGADEASRAAQVESLRTFTSPQVPESWRQKLRDEVPGELKELRDAANSQSTADWKAIDDKQDWEAFRQEKLKLLRASLGATPQRHANQPPIPSRIEHAGTLAGDGYRIEKLLYLSSYGHWITGNLYAPHPPREKMPGILISHAHHTPKEHGELQDMGVLWARAGCYVLVPDHLGHGERREHPFRSKDDYARPFQVGRQDYYHRYDLSLQWNLVGESLMGMMALDLMSGVSLLLNREGIDNDKIILLGAVAGGGDPAAVAAALDERIAGVAPFNFGGPQPETRYPLPDDAETSFNYGGSGSWESTRNLAGSLRDGTLPWVMVGSIAPRKLIYGHEFAWDRERDPVWKRLEKIYGWHHQPGSLSFAMGHGTLTSKDPPGSHCTHIGKIHRKQIHEALARWFDIRLPNGEESTERREASELRCWTDELRTRLQPKPLTSLLQSTAKALAPQNPSPARESPTQLRIAWQSEAVEVAGATFQQLILQSDSGRLIPLLLAAGKTSPALERPGVFVLCRSAKQDFLRQRASDVASLLDAGACLALPDLFNSGLTGPGSDLGRRSSNTSRSASLAMSGIDVNEERARDAAAVLHWLQKERSWAVDRLAMWGDSLIEPTEPGTNYRIPRDDDSQLPRGPDPFAQQTLQGLLRRGLPLTHQAVYLRGGVHNLGTALEQPLVLLPHDACPLPEHGKFDFPARLAASAAHVRWEGTVDGWNRLVATDQCATHDRSQDDALEHSPANWILARLQAARKTNR